MEGKHRLNTVTSKLERIMEESDLAKHNLEYAQLMLWTLENPYAAEWIRHIWLRMGEYNLSKPETIRRCWQKIREKHPEYLSGDQVLRKEAEKEFEEYARQ